MIERYEIPYGLYFAIIAAITFEFEDGDDLLDTEDSLVGLGTLYENCGMFKGLKEKGAFVTQEYTDFTKMEEGLHLVDHEGSHYYLAPSEFTNKGDFMEPICYREKANEVMCDFFDKIRKHVDDLFFGMTKAEYTIFEIGDGDEIIIRGIKSLVDSITRHQPLIHNTTAYSTLVVGIDQLRQQAEAHYEYIEYHPEGKYLEDLFKLLEENDEFNNIHFLDDKFMQGEG